MTDDAREDRLRAAGYQVLRHLEFVGACRKAGNIPIEPTDCEGRRWVLGRWMYEQQVWWVPAWAHELVDSLVTTRLDPKLRVSALRVIGGDAELRDALRAIGLLGASRGEVTAFLLALGVTEESDQ